MNSLKIQIKPFYKNNPFHLKDDQIHILSTNKNEEEIKQLLLQMNYENYSIFIQLELENYNYGYLFIDNKEYEIYYYNKLAAILIAASLFFLIAFNTERHLKVFLLIIFIIALMNNVFYYNYI